MIIVSERLLRTGLPTGLGASKATSVHDAMVSFDHLVSCVTAGRSSTGMDGFAITRSAGKSLDRGHRQGQRDRIFRGTRSMTQTIGP